MLMHYFFMPDNFPENGSVRIIFSVWRMHSENPFTLVSASIFVMVLVKLFDPHQCLMCSGFVYTSQTISTGASSKRDVLCSLPNVSLFSFA